MAMSASHFDTHAEVRRTPVLEEHSEQQKFYVYTPLKANQIRILYLEITDLFDDDVRIELRAGYQFDSDVFQSIAHPSYTALSYAWGQTCEDGSHLDESITCNGHNLRITSTLKQALRRIRQISFLQLHGSQKPNLEIYYRDGVALAPLWIDAICINQQDVQERNDQVLLMAQVFSSCQTLLIWLGEPDAGEPGSAQCEIFNNEQDGDASTGTIGSLDQDHYNTALQSILSRPWFARRWVIQEAAPEHVDGYIMLGENVCPRDRLATHLDSQGLLDIANPLAEREFKCTIFQTLYIYDESRCQDPRDGVFALKALSRNGYKVQVDYNRDIRDTYLNLVKGAIFGDVDLDEGFAQLFGSAPPQKWPIDSSEAIVMLAISSCKRPVREVNRESGMEQWLPDWTAEQSFDSLNHHLAVQLCVHSEFDIQSLKSPAFSLRLMTSRNGYSYFGIDGIFIESNLAMDQRMLPPGQEQSESTDSVASWVKNTYRSVKSIYDRFDAQSDRIWLPMALFENFEDQQSQMSLAFILRPSATKQSPFGDRALYTLETCLSVRGLQYRDQMQWRTSTSWEQWVGLTEYLSWEKVCLE